MADLIVMYQGELEAHPAITQVLTMATLLLAGDVVSQTFFQKKPFDTRQAAHFFIVGVFYTGPCSVTWFRLVERLVVMDGVAAAVIKALAGQVIYTPPYTLGLLVLYGLLQGQSWKEVLDSVRSKYGAVLISRYMVYPAAQLINFEFVPVVYRTMYGSVIALFWNIYLSWKANRLEGELPVDPVQKDVIESA
ncbi:protein Mpv17 [Ixodes scapularis]|uniref:protein Mpv17 n=1 Tax=Ixodes scapularis TaxID=6945 RepID=UPI001A9DEFBA|nr:protein Mpv17 [Ixodes scapularis]